MLDGFLNINKPIGCTSRDVVNQVQRLVKPVKVGHAGTLDPLASGVLVVAVGQATRLIESVQSASKRYRGVFRLGCTSETEDTEGEVVPLDDPPIPSREQLASACATFVGRIEQVPPRFSALKVNGKRAYRLARKGVQVEMKPRVVEIHHCDLTEFDYPHFTIDIGCGSGTYIRSLGRDIGVALHSGAVMTALERTSVGPFELQATVQPDQLSADTLAAQLLPMQTALPNTPQVLLVEDESVALHNGLRIANRFMLPTETTAAALNSTGRLMSLVAATADGQIRPIRNFPIAE